MPKRKFSDLESSNLAEPLERRRPRSKSSSKPFSTSSNEERSLHSNLEEIIAIRLPPLVDSLKIHRGIERQKLGRRVKTVSKAGSTLPIPTTHNGTANTDSDEKRKRLDAEIQTLKSLDLKTTAELHLLKTLLKTKSLVSASGFPKDRVERRAKILTAQNEWSTERGNILGRLFKSDDVQQAVGQFVDSVKRLILSNRALEGSGGGEKARDGLNAHPHAKRMGCIAMSSTESKEEATEDLEELSEDDDARHDRYVSRLAGSSKDEDEDEDDDKALGRDKAEEQETQSPSPTNHSTSSDSDNDPKLNIPSSSAPSHQPPKAPPKPKASTTTFLPSLSLAGYYSGSDDFDSASPPQAENEAMNIQQPRKNRMGQQARRQLWEKKYGNSARHLDGEGGPPAQKKGAMMMMRKETKGKRIHREGAMGGATVRGNGKRQTNGHVERRGEGKLHPSWEAARKVKGEKQNISFSGKKIVF